MNRRRRARRTLAVFGPYDPDSGGWSGSRDITLHGANTRISVRLAAGFYEVGFWVDPPYALLEPNFGREHSGGFHIRTGQTTRLGIVRPAAEWILAED